MTDGVVVLLPGIPGKEGSNIDGATPYPESAADFKKVLSDFGIQSEYSVPEEERVVLGLKSREDWLPIILIGIEFLAVLEAGILVELLKAYLYPDGNSDKELPHPLLHIDWRVQRADRSEERFRADGSAAEVLDALADFEEHLRDEQGD